MDQGLFITFEGIEASGKSTQAVALARALGDRAVLTREPGGTPLGRRVREILLDAETTPIPDVEALLFLADRAQHLHEVVRPGIAAGRIVLSDRYQDSSMAYQSVGRGVGDLIPSVFRHIGGLAPDLTILIDLDVDVAIERLRSRGAANRLDAEAPAFHGRVRQAFLNLAAADPSRFEVFDGAKDVASLSAEIVERVKSRFGGRV
ncbi:MAG: dTMP kinase [Vicinamibacteria bacterium]|nr:dTMP kinase [Vicinamibacteria bacterium]